MLRTLLFAAASITLFGDPAAAQPFQPDYNPVFEDGVIPSIYIAIDPTYLEAILTLRALGQLRPALEVFL